MTADDPVRSVVTAVAREAVRAAGASGILLHRPGTPEHTLFAEWAQAEGIRVVTVDEDEAAGPDLLATDPANKLVLLLEGPSPGARFLPLGDLWPDRVAARTEGATAPATLQGDRDAVDAVVAALSAALEEGYGLGALEARLPTELAARVRAAVLRTAPHFRPPLIPKLTGWTPGIDPGL